MSRRRFVAYFIALSACSTVAFASYLMDQTASNEPLASAVYFASPAPHEAYLSKFSLHRNAPRSAQIASVN